MYDFDGFVDDSCYKELLIKKDLRLLFDYCSNCSKHYFIKFIFSHALFLSIQSSFLKISRRGDYLYINTTCAQKIKKKNKKNGLPASKADNPQTTNYINEKTISFPECRITARHRIHDKVIYQEIA